VDVIKEQKPRLLDYDLTGCEENPEGLICGGTMQVFVEPIIPVPTIFILGAGHIGFAVSLIARLAGFRVIVVDDRPAYANAQRFPDAAGFVVDDPADVVPSLHINPVSYMVIACRGHLEDQRALAQALKTSARYIGMIGSKKKIRTVLDNLRNEGFGDDDLKRIHAPIGLPVAAETPEEISISIMAEIVACRHQREQGK
jgi:xanthine dehydrogenase accessory factor